MSRWIVDGSIYNETGLPGGGYKKKDISNIKKYNSLDLYAKDKPITVFGNYSFQVNTNFVMGVNPKVIRSVGETINFVADNIVFFYWDIPTDNVSWLKITFLGYCEDSFVTELGIHISFDNSIIVQKNNIGTATVNVEKIGNKLLFNLQSSNSIKLSDQSDNSGIGYKISWDIQFQTYQK